MSLALTAAPTITDLAVVGVNPSGLVLRETAPGETVDELRELTEPDFTVSDGVVSWSAG